MFLLLFSKIFLKPFLLIDFFFFEDINIKRNCHMLLG